MINEAIAIIDYSKEFSQMHLSESLTFPDTPGWSFEVDEVSANVFQVKGCDFSGCTVEMTGTDPDELIEKCRHEAKAINHND